MISVYIPLYNSAQWCEELQLVEGFRYIASDNCSQDGSGDILRRKGVEVITQSENLGRVGNWEFCVRHFLESGAPWMKWLFTGDVMLPNAAATINQAIASYPEVRLILAAYYTVSDTERLIRYAFPENRLLTSADFMAETARRGNLCGSLVGHVYHRDALLGGYEFGNSAWVADMRLVMSLAQRHPTLYWREPVGEFLITQRLYRRQYIYSVETAIDEYVIRQDAARAYLDLTHDEPGYKALQQTLNQDFERIIVQRSLLRAEDFRDIKHLLEPMQERQDFLELLTANLDLKTLLGLTYRNVIAKVKRKLKM
ncbi:MAG: hypothetical protein ACK456_14200 [Pseudanabaenaceae cyanobacterium]|jgi:glycosyltransferase involved in cell wall biosynthesis